MPTPQDYPALDLKDVPELIRWGMDAEDIYSINENMFFSNRFPTEAPVDGKVKWQLWEWHDELPYVVEPGSTAEAPVVQPKYEEEEFEFFPMRWEEKHELNEQIINGLRKPGTERQKYGVEWVTRLGRAFRKKDMVFKELMAWLAVTYNGFEYYEDRPGKKALEKVNYGINMGDIGALDYWDDETLAPPPTPSGGPAVTLRNWLNRISEQTGWPTQSIQILMNDVTRRAFVDHSETQGKLALDIIGYGSLADIKDKYPEFGEFTIFDGKYKIVYEILSDITIATADLDTTIGPFSSERTFGLKEGDPIYLKSATQNDPNKSTTVYIKNINHVTKTFDLYIPDDFATENQGPFAPPAAETVTYTAGNAYIRGWVKYLQDGRIVLLPPNNLGGIPLMSFVPVRWGIKADYSQYSGLNIDVWEDRIEPGKKQWIRMADSGLWTIPFAQHIYSWNVFFPK